MRFNMGCGVNFLDGYWNVDKFDSDAMTKRWEAFKDIEIWDLEQFPWPWADSTADEILFNHSLEHMGREPEVFCRIMQEIYRIAKNRCVIQINVPHPRHDDFINDPTHVRIITPEVLSLFSWRNCEEWKKGGFANSPLAFYYDVDFEITNVQAVPDMTAPILDVRQGKNIEVFTKIYNNIIKEYRITALAMKPIHL